MRPTAAVTRAPFRALRWWAVPLYTHDVSDSPSLSHDKFPSRNKPTRAVGTRRSWHASLQPYAHSGKTLTNQSVIILEVIQEEDVMIIDDDH